ncbi:MAG: SpoIIE family protein phosphatase [Spirochaetia bacterium]|nr:SpoIIE family protein phosphatase [Spirochaetia bacterium]
MKQVRGISLRVINEISVSINSEQELQSLLTIIMNSARELLNTEGSSLLLYDETENNLIFDIALGQRGGILAARRVPVGQGIAGLCAKDQSPIIVNDAQSDERVMHEFDRESGYVTRNLLAVPMLALDKFVGVLEVVNTMDNRNFSNMDVRLLSYLSNMAGISLYNRKLYNELKLRAEELDCIYTISNEFRMAEDISEVVDGIMKSIRNVLEVGRLSLVIKESGTNHFKLMRMVGFSVEDHDLRIDPEEGVCSSVFLTGKALLVRDIETDLDDYSFQPERYKTKSFISVPIIRGAEVVGVLNAADKKNGEVFDDFELKVLSTVASQLASAMSRIESKKQTEQLEKYRRDMETAAMIQKNSLTELPDVISGIYTACRYRACREVGGDFYDLLYHSENRISIVVADVAGKGVPAALFMEYSKTLLSGIIPRYLDPAASLKKANQEIYEKTQTGIFVTAMLVQIEKEMSRIRLASAGHNNQILYRVKEKKIEELSSSGKPLGIYLETEYMEKIVEYSPGDLLVLYTDGISEANNEKLEEFGMDRFYRVIQENAEKKPEEIMEILFEEVDRFRNGFEPNDDATAVILRLV